MLQEIVEEEEEELLERAGTCLERFGTCLGHVWNLLERVTASTGLEHAV